MSFWVAGAVVVGSVVGAVASNKAAKKQAKAADKAIEAQERLVGPYSYAGQDALPGVQEFVDNGAEFSDTQAFKDIVNQMKASGGNFSGNKATALSSYYATNFRPQRFNELTFLPTLGANAAAGQATNTGNLLTAKGDAQAAGYLGAANSINSGLGSLAFLGQSGGYSLGGSNTGGAVQPGQHGYGGFG